MQKYEAELSLAGRVLLSTVMLWAALFNVTHWSSQVASLTPGSGPTMAAVLLGAATAVEIIFGIPLLIGYRTRGSAAILAVYALIAAVALHPFWAVAADQRADQLLHFMESVGIAGGLLVVAAFGPGRISVDARQGRV